MKIIVTGAFGNVGQWVLTELVKQDHEVIAFELQNDRTEKKYRQLSSLWDFEVIWGDLTNEDAVKEMIMKYKPEAISHVAAVIAPTAYVIPEVAYRVNVLGSQYLINAVQHLDNFQRFIFVSSYSVHGSRNPYKNLDPLTGESPVDPSDNYGKHKIVIEQALKVTDFDWTIIRLPAVFSTDSEFGTGPEFRKFGFLLDPDRNESAIDARDAGLAIANAITADCSRRTLDICGDPKKGWTGKAKNLQAGLMGAMGLKPFTNQAYRRSDPEVDESWYFEDIVDPTESQKILQYQRSSMEEYLNTIKKQSRFIRYILKLFSPLIGWSVARKSSYYEKSGTDSRPIWEAIKEEFNLDETRLPLFREED